MRCSTQEKRPSTQMPEHRLFRLLDANESIQCFLDSQWTVRLADDFDKHKMFNDDLSDDDIKKSTLTLVKTLPAPLIPARSSDELKETRFNNGRETMRPDLSFQRCYRKTVRTSGRKTVRLLELR